GKLVASHHATEPLSPAEAVALWQNLKLPPASALKHVEPLGTLESGDRLLETQRRLREAFLERPVTVLATGALALPFRCLLAKANALASRSFGAAAAGEGQRRLEDAAREQRKRNPAPARRAILGSDLAHSRSPRVHRQPFDRIDVPAETEVG